MNTVWILGDQLSPEHAALSQTSPDESRVLMIESKPRATHYASELSAAAYV
jgi:deoxyribodipyrimidine photolyase-like uncharacterized protein